MSDRHRFRLDSPLATLAGAWDATRLERVVDNLVANAVKYSPEGGDIAVEVETVTRDGRAWAELRVRDHGIGIPAPDLGRVFDEFRRGSDVGGIAGSGIGLASVAPIVEGHGGVVLIDSEAGNGSTFTVRLPLDGA